MYGKPLMFEHFRVQTSEDFHQTAKMESPHEQIDGAGRYWPHPDGAFKYQIKL